MDTGGSNSFCTWLHFLHHCLHHRRIPVLDSMTKSQCSTRYMLTLSSSSAHNTAAPMSIFTAPQWVNSFYSKFPLVVLEQEDTLDWKQAQTVGSVQSPYTLWVRQHLHLCC